MRNKILVVAPSTRNLGGQSLQAKNLLEVFKKNDKFEIELTENDPETFFKVKYLRTVVKSLKFWFNLSKKIPKSDLVHVFSSARSGYLIASIPPLIFSKLYGKPVLLHYHSGELETHLKKGCLTALPTMRKFNRIVVPSDFLAKIFVSYNIEAEVIPNFIRLDKFKFRQRNPLRPVFLSNRNFEEHYNVKDVIKAFRLIVQFFPEAKLIIVGYGTQEKRLKRLVLEFDLTKSVEFIGKVTNEQMPIYYDKADIYLNSSLVDNMPVSLIESFACGLPVVSYASGGIPFMIENRKNGILVPKGDFKALAESAIELLKNNCLAQEIIRNALKEAKKYDQKIVAQRWEKMYSQMLSLPTASSSDEKPL